MLMMRQVAAVPADTLIDANFGVIWATVDREGWPAGKNPPKPRYRPPPRAGDTQKPST